MSDQIYKLSITFHYETTRGNSIAYSAPSSMIGHQLSPIEVMWNSITELAALASRLGISEGVLLDRVREGYTLAGGWR